MKKRLIQITIFLVVAIFIFTGCTPAKEAASASASPAQSQAAATASQTADKSGLKPYTLMVYMCGSDLESENGLASADIAEMAQSGYDPNNMNIVLFTGGSTKWQTEGIPADTDSIWQLTADGLTSLEDAGKISMGDPATLTSFINYAYEKFPAQQYGLILWDHGAGSVQGYGSDDLFEGDSLTLDELGQSLAASKAATEKFSFIGFDACLMATIETAWTLDKYADYLVASEELEPGSGWDYT
ncbi:MAG: clostripain-related cysteine peptidase, partial [Eubacteriales bacterium]